MRPSAFSEEHAALAREWRKLSRAATFVAVLTSPGVFALFYSSNGWAFGPSLLATFFVVIAFRGLIDLIAHRMIKRPSLYGADREALLDDAMARRRVWFWRGKYKFVLWVGGSRFASLVAVAAISGRSLSGALSLVGNAAASVAPLLLVLGIQLPLLFFVNLIILFGPLLFFGLKQMKGYEPGDADWGVSLEDVRGQREPKEDVTRVIELWQSGEQFRKAGGKPERGLLFIGAPGTGKTMLSKAIATSFNSPIVLMPGSGFAQTFIGMDVIIVMFLIRKARKLARKWGGQCIIFIDEIDAVGLRRQALGAGIGIRGGPQIESLHDGLFFGPQGALTSSGDLILETREWRERLFAERASAPAPVLPPGLANVYGQIQNYMFPGGMMGGGGMALNQLLVQMDGVDEPPFWRKFWTNRLNTFLDATYLAPRKIGGTTLRVRPPKPRSEQIYFIGATNVPIDRLDPALIRPGRMGRHVWFRTPTKDDRKDIFDLYLDRVAHEPSLDTEKRRDELARITNGYSPAMIEQVCSMALTRAHSEGRPAFEWLDLVEAMTTIESGTAQRIEYHVDEARATALHEAGHAAASHVYMENTLSTRLSIRKRGGSLGHHQAIETEERFSKWRHWYAGNLVWILGAMAAEHEFYGENSNGVGGDLQSATWTAAYMVGFCGMAPEPIELPGTYADAEAEEQARADYVERFRRIGLSVMNRAAASNPQMTDPVTSVLADRGKRDAAAEILGQAFITAVCLVRHNRDALARIAEVLLEHKELHGDEVVEVLDAVGLEAPTIDLSDATIWPKL
jgi:ATP-dependent Zn protease